MEVKNPLFIVGTGRCGSTIFHHVLTYHPKVTWLSSWAPKYASKPHMNRLAMQIMDLPLPDRYLRKRIYPGEWYAFWNYYYRGFGEPCRDLCREDVTPRVKSKIRGAMAEMLSDRRPHLLIKITGWPRLGFLKEIFPDAKFIHIYRDGRAVANSLLQVWWWPGWRGPENWGCGELSPEQRQKWERSGKSFVVLAALEWEILMTSFEQARQTIPPEDLMEIRYEDLCQEPVGLFRQAAEFAGLEWSSQFESRVKQFTLESANDKWRKDLTSLQQKELNESIQDILQKYGYA